MASISSKNTLMLAAVLGLASAFALHAQESAFEIMTGGTRPAESQPWPPSSSSLASGETQNLQFPPRISRERARPASTDAMAYCVRTCDGRYFPAPPSRSESRAETCHKLCPASDTKLFYGGTIEGASSSDGKPYSALSNAFLYRKELVAGCTCNGKDVVGLASIGLDHDKTLRQGDIVATHDGLEVVRSASDGVSHLTTLPKSERSRFARPPIVASQ